MAKTPRDARDRSPDRSPRSKGPAIRPPAPPALDPDPQEVYDRSVSEYEGDSRRETEVAPGEGVSLTDTRSASPKPAPPRHPVKKKRPRK